MKIKKKIYIKRNIALTIAKKYDKIKNYCFTL